jgi:hypothetical protein
MQHVQFRLELPRCLERRGPQRCPFHPSRGQGPYRFPHAVQDRLVTALAPFRNREAAYALAVFLARFWSMPGRVALPFPIDRRALAGHRDLGLTEARVRGAIKTLEEIGYLARFVISGSSYRATEDGLRRKPVPFQFGTDYMPAFIAANRRAAAARERQEGPRRIKTPDSARGPSVASAGPPLNSPKDKSAAERTVIMGELRSRPPASVPDSPLEAALERLRKAAGWQGPSRAAAGRDS